MVVNRKDNRGKGVENRCVEDEKSSTISFIRQEERDQVSFSYQITTSDKAIFVATVSNAFTPMIHLCSIVWALRVSKFLCGINMKSKMI